MALGVVGSKSSDRRINERRRSVGRAVGILLILALCLGLVLLAFRGRDLAFDGEGDAVGTGDS
jgi:hypothetical protein